ncbi:MAG TPA: ABC transporter substrate-binding protein [Gaiellaceae bacterium]|jgi:ABC-type nitrate/sulfonate/bicarbonate transport system substrate-binding protein
MDITHLAGKRGMRRLALGLAVVALVSSVAVVAAGAQRSSSASTKGPLIDVTETGFKVISLAPVYIAIDHGDFKRNGLNFTLQELQSGALGAPTIISGNAQFTDLGVNDVVNLYQQKKSVELVYNLEKSLTMDLIFSKKAAQEKGITPSSPLKKRFLALKGLHIGITTPGAPTDIYPRYFMKQVGLDPAKDATFVPIGNAAALVGALQAGRIDAFMLSPPGPYLAQKDGFGTVMIKGDDSLPVFKTYDFTSVAVTQSYAAAHPDVVADYVKAVDEATTWMIAHPAQATALLHKNQFSDTDMPTLTLSVKLFLETANPTGLMTKAGVANQVDVLKQMDAMTGTAPLTDGVIWSDKFTKGK